MIVLFQCIVEQAVKMGVKGLAEVIDPRLGQAVEFVQGVYAKYRDRLDAPARRAEVARIVVLTAEEVSAQAGPFLAVVPPGLRGEIEAYLSLTPAAVRRSLERQDDPTGKSVPPGFEIASERDLAKLLPTRVPHFRQGHSVPGLDSWRLVKLLGVGGFGEVWLARHEFDPSRRSAVKFFLDEDARHALLLHERQQIGRVMKQANHPNLVPLLECSLGGDCPWLMYEYVEGGTLVGGIGAWRSLPPDRRIERVVVALHDLAMTVAHLHGLTPPLVHRDLKPANVLICKSTDRLRITDLGLGGVATRGAIAQDSRSQLAQSGRLPTMLLGSHSPVYASPEQRRGDGPDPRDDVHALGVIGYQMLTGRLDAAPGPDMGDELSDAGVPPELVRTLRACASQDASRRPTSAAELVAELQAFLPKGKQGKREDEYYQRGAGLLKEDAESALVWFRKAADLGHVPALLAISEAYRNGAYPGVHQDYAESMRWCRKAADLGDAEAHTLIGLTYDRGWGVPQEYAEAMRWYRKAIDLGSVRAYSYLGMLFYLGNGVSRDSAEAMRHFRKAADLGDGWARNNLGSIDYDHAGAPKDRREAMQWRIQAANKGDADLAYNLGWSFQYAQGGFKKDLPASLMWYRKAAALGLADAREKVAELEAVLC